MTKFKTFVAALVIATVFVSATAQVDAAPKPKYRAALGPYTAEHSGVITNAGVTGDAKLKDAGDRVTVALHAEGLIPGRTYPAHVHVGHCTDYGPHFKYESTSATSESNEIWLSLTANDDGRAADKVERPSFDTTQPLSIVIHEDTTNTAPLRRIACGDFVPQHD